jgi:hypothetical protein
MDQQRYNHTNALTPAVNICSRDSERPGMRHENHLVLFQRILYSFSERPLASANYSVRLVLSCVIPAHSTLWFHNLICISSSWLALELSALLLMMK